MVIWEWNVSQTEIQKPQIKRIYSVLPATTEIALVIRFILWFSEILQHPHHHTSPPMPISRVLILVVPQHSYITDSPQQNNHQIIQFYYYPTFQHEDRISGGIVVWEFAPLLDSVTENSNTTNLWLTTKTWAMGIITFVLFCGFLKMHNNIPITTSLHQCTSLVC